MITGKKIAYVKVSTAEQNEARQIEAMKPYEVDKVFLEKASAKSTLSLSNSCNSWNILSKGLTFNEGVKPQKIN